ncbi:glycosyltransferase [Halegenticoccus soli]|uniref:glycosyltransferase n=1 Tax=Halegenticoccus soli TaxID=1985678 RepID=UPI000C6E59F1|nr:glycosyltransferase family 2 protein [Halegenticoccus soli]
MDVLTPAEAARSARDAVGTAALAALVGGGLVVPALAVGEYARLLSGLILAATTGFAIRMLLSALFALREPDRPPEVDSDAALPSVTVVVTAYNEADALAETVSACLRQSYPPERLDVVVGYEAASTDGTPAIAERLAAESPRVEAVRRDAPPAGKAAAVNRALRRARGEIVASIDAGQRFEPGAVRRAAGWFLADGGTWCVKGRCYGTNAAASLVALHATVERHVVERIEFVARDASGGFDLFTGGQAFFRRAALDALGPFDETVLLEDLDMAARIHARGGRIRVDPGIVTAERNPETLAAWWSQRKRWARGGMQVARRYLARLPADSDLPTTVRLDALYTFCTVLTLPALALASPLVPLSVLGGAPAPPPSALAASTAAAAAALLLPYAVFLRDARAGRAHDPREYLVPITLPLYLGLQAAVVVDAFVDEFVRRRPAVYVTSREASPRGSPIEE